MKKTIVVSAVNLRKGGTLTILRDCLKYLSGLSLSEEYKIVALVHKKELALYPGIEYIEMPWTIKSWILRLWCEYVTMRRISHRLSPVYLWLSLHDTSPCVKAERQAVYCHNPYPFYRWKWRELFMNYHIVCFAWFSKYIYRINIHSNRYVLVQQKWIKNSFVQMFGLAPERIIVTLPGQNDTPNHKIIASDGIYRFLFPSYGDIHKNFELICMAANMLAEEIEDTRFRVMVTIFGDENRYTKWLYKKWGHLKCIEFAGFMSRDKLYEAYAQADCLIFPSRVETWGLPISEFASFGKPMLLADLPYAHETAGGSRAAAFFNPQDPYELKEQMKRLINGDHSFLSPVPEVEISAPVTRTWAELFELLLKNN